MTDTRLQLFVDCPWGGCERDFCTCLEQEIDEDVYAEFGDEEMDPGELAELLGYAPRRTVRRYCPACGQVVHADEADPDRVPSHDRFDSTALTGCTSSRTPTTRCTGSRTRQSLEPAP